MGKWGSTSGWNHAISYYLKAIISGVGVGVVSFLLVDSGSEGAGLLLAGVAILGWPLIMTVLMFNEVDRLVSRRINQYHQNAWGQQQAAANAQQRQARQANQQQARQANQQQRQAQQANRQQRQGGRGSSQQRQSGQENAQRGQQSGDTRGRGDQKQ